MPSDTFKKLAFFGRSAKKKKQEKKKTVLVKPVKDVKLNAKSAKKKAPPPAPAPKKKKAALPSTMVERKVEQNTLKSLKKPFILILFLLAVISALGSIVVVYGPYAGYLQMDYTLILLICGGMLFLSFILLVIVTILKYTGYIKIQRTLTKVSFFLSLLLCVAMLALQARDPAYLSVACAALFLVFNRIFARKNLLDY